MKKELIAHRDPKSPVSEVFRTLRTNIQFMNTNNKLKTLLVTSTLPNEGKSWVTSNLAVTFAQAGKKVVLVDADMRKGRQYTIFEVSPRPGLSNYLSGFDINTGEETSEDLANYIQETEIPNLYIIPAGNIPPNPSELLISTKMISLLDRLKERLKIDEGGTTPDGKFSIDATRCVGACGLAPVFTINNEVYGKATVKKLDEVLDEYMKKED